MNEVEEHIQKVMADLYTLARGIPSAAKKSCAHDLSPMNWRLVGFTEGENGDVNARFSTHTTQAISIE
jgi:hypothetical protein